MKVKVFTIYDSKGEMYHKPFYMATQSMAIREILDMANDSETMIGKHPEDYTLFYMGEYDDHTASFDLEESKVSLGCAIEFKGKEQL